MISTAPVSQHHINEILVGLRAADKFTSLRDFTPDETIEWVIKKSFFTQTIFFRGKLGVIWGLQTKSLVDPYGYIWMLTTNIVEEHPKAFLRKSKTITRQALQACPILRCHVDMAHVKSHDWLIWLGFKTLGIESIDEKPYWVMELRAE